MGSSAAPAVDIAVLDALTKQLAEAGPDIRDTLLRSYLEQGDLQIAGLQSAAHEGDAATVGRIAHSMRSSSALLGAGDLAGLLATTEAAVRDTTPDLLALATVIAIEYDRVSVDMVWLRSNPPTAAGPTATPRLS